MNLRACDITVWRSEVNFQKEGTSSHLVYKTLSLLSAILVDPWASGMSLLPSHRMLRFQICDSAGHILQVFMPGIELRLSGLRDKCLDLLNHLAYLSK